jgi:uncharacterized FlaG/YvyC family protein
MTDQVNPVGGLVSGLPVALPAVVAAGSASGRDRPARVADPLPQGQGGPAAASSSGSPDKAVEQINGHLQQTSTQLRVQVDTETGKTIYKVVDPTTGQVVLQVPSAQVLAMAHALQNLDKQTGASGVLVDQKG